MKQICTFCRTNVVNEYDRLSEGNITEGICNSCVRNFHTSSSAVTLKELIDAIDVPLLVMQAEPRQVYTANRKALELFNKKLDQIEKHRGGQVFDCIYAFTEAGCGKDVHCQPCKIKNAVVETLTTGRPCAGISVALDIKRDSGMRSYTLQVTTEKIGDMALVRIDRYQPVA